MAHETVTVQRGMVAIFLVCLSEEYPEFFRATRRPVKPQCAGTFGFGISRENALPIFEVLVVCLSIPNLPAKVAGY